MSTATAIAQEIAEAREQLQMKKMREELAALKAELAAPPPSLKKGKKASGEKKATTNALGPSAFNTLVRSTWIEMASKAGVVYGELVCLDGVAQEDKAALTKAEAAWKKAAAAAGATYQAAMKEAGNRNRAEKGRPSLEEEKALSPQKTLATTATTEEVEVLQAAPAAAAAPAAPAPAVKGAKEAQEAEFETHHSKFEYQGTSYYMDIESGEVLTIAGFCELGRHVGMYDPDTEEIDFTA